MAKTGQRAQADNKIISSKSFSGTYDNLRSLGEFLEKNPENLSYKSDGKTSAIKIKVVNSSSKHTHIIFYDEKLLNEFTDEENWLDATFRSRPNVRGTAQLMTIMGRKNNKVRLYTSLFCIVL